MSDSGAPGTELAEIQRTLRESPDVYWRDDDMRSRYLRLLSNDAGVVQRAATPSPAARERREIEKLMGDYNGPYWKGPDSARLRARYLELLVEGGAQLTPSAESVESQKPVLVIPDGATEVEIAAGRTATEVLLALGPAARASLEASFNALPPAVICGCRDELAAPRPYAEPATWEQLQNFTRSPRGRVLAPEWGNATRRRLGLLFARLDRLLSRLPDQAAREAAGNWLKTMQIDQARAVFTILSAS